MTTIFLGSLWARDGQEDAVGQLPARRHPARRRPSDKDSIAGRCPRTGMLGAVVTTSAMSVGNRCAWAEANVGAVLTQHRTDPVLAPEFSSVSGADRSQLRGGGQHPARRRGRRCHGRELRGERGSATGGTAGARHRRR
ncbi:MAG: DUF1028 domain-containing protein [Reyranellales bacterium]